MPDRLKQTPGNERMELQVTRLEEVKRGTLRIWLNDEPAFRLSKAEAQDLHLQEGSTFSPEELAQMHITVLAQKAKRRCLRYLEGQDHTERQVREKLRLEDYPEDVIDAAVDYARSFHYIDDLRYASSYIRAHARNKNVFQLRTALLSKGVPEELIDAALEEEEGPDEESQIRLFIRKRGADPENTGPEERRKLVAALMRRGYSLSSVKRALDENGSSI